MPLHEPIIPYRCVTPLIDILRERDPNGVRSALTRIGIDPSEGLQAASSLPMSRFDRLLVHASARLQRTDLVQPIEPGGQLGPRERNVRAS